MAYRIEKTLARKHLERRLAPLRDSDDLRRPPKGWIKAIREALGMTTAQLADRIGAAQPWIARLEATETADSATLKTLRRVAEGLDCELVYALVPKEPLDDILRARAELVAEKQLARTNHTMRLENQALTARDLKSERERLITELTRGDLRRLWDEP